jgi:GNAT superfamily N-acetyltransferase
MVDKPANLAKARSVKPSQGYSLREATPADIPTLVNHRRRMFEDMAAAGGTPHDLAALDAMDVGYAAHLSLRLVDGAERAWVIESGDRIVASGAVLLSEWLPLPSNLTGRLAYLHSVYTLPEHRRRGLARRIVVTAIEFCRAQGLRRLVLHASRDGRPLYESLGFAPTNEMRLVLD